MSGSRRATPWIARAEAGPVAAVEHPVAATFLRGLTVGALVGAAIVGSLLVGRRRAAPPLVGRPGANETAGAR